MKKTGLFYLFMFLFLTLSLAIVNGSVFINEIEVNPDGIDSGNEWVEIFNDGAPINLSGWYLQNKDGDNYTLDIIINNFYFLDFLSGLTNTDQTLRLYDNNGLLKDSFPNFYDEENDERTWSRVPDGTGDFIFQENTKGTLNQPIEIENKISTPSCILSGENITLSAEVSGLCLDKVIFSLNNNGEWINFTGTKIGSNFQTTINLKNFSVSELIEWTVYATDCFDTTIQDGIEVFYINSATALSAIPPNPNGLNGWYITQPFFTLANEDASGIFYQWDSQEEIEYNFPFGLEDTPNNATLSGGILELNYWSDVCEEEHHRKIIKTDFSNPEIKNLVPGNNSLVINNARPRISALLDEKYQSNSGIDKNKSFMYLDGILVDEQVNDVNALDAEIFFIPNFDLDEGMHEVEVQTSDKSGRESGSIWTFNISLNMSLDFNVYAPEDKIYGNKKVIFNISASEELDKIEYINYNEGNPRWKILCNDCEEYGFLKKRTRTLLEGENNITIKGGDRFGNSHEKSILLIIESRKPRITKTMPEKGFTSGHFSIEFEEDNPVSVALNYGNDVSGFVLEELNLSACVINKKKTICDIQINLLEYDLEEIESYFIVSDIANNTASSRTRNLLVDSTPPIVNDFGYEIEGREVRFMFNVTEPNLQKIIYIDHNGLPRPKTICTKLIEEICVKKSSFLFGEHNLTIEIIDKAGNKEFIEVVFEI